MTQGTPTWNSVITSWVEWSRRWEQGLRGRWYVYQFSSVQSLSHVRLFATPWIAARQASLSITNSQRLLKLMSIKSVMLSSHLILCRPLLLLPPIPPSIRVFPMSQLMRWSKYWSFSFSISPSNEHPGLIPFRMNWLDLLAVQGTLKSLLHQICVYLWLIHVYACQKPAQPCKAIILQLKINKLQNIDKYKLPSTS